MMCLLKPQVLFDTPIYETAVNTCWNLKGYKTQIVIMTEFLRLQQENQVPAHITVEDMSNLLVQESNKTLREQLWKFKLEDLEETEAKPLLKLVWAVNINNKMRDVEFQAWMLLRFPEAKPPEFQAPKLLSMVKDYVELLKEKQQNTEISRLHTTEEVVIEVVPRVLQGFWQLPPQPLLNMASQSLSVLCTSVTKATLDKVCKTLTAPEGHANFSRSIRDTMVHTILKEIREQHPPDILLNSISNFAPALLTSIAGVSKKHICELFQPQIPSKLDGHTAASQSPSRIQEGVNITVPVVSPAKAPCLLEVKPSEEPPAKALCLLEVKPSEEPPAKALCLLEVKPSEEPPAKALCLLEVKPSEEPPAKAPSLLEVKPSEEPPATAPCLLEVKPSEEPPTAHLSVSEEFVPVTVNCEEIKAKKKKKEKMGFFQKLCRTLCCCVSPSTTDCLYYSFHPLFSICQITSFQ
ncbi:uncharacterized protein LOC115772998 isoform X2 [Archocentrus centrarchus]|uniref:uncharacterized protein LOC115772998 isoform X2 n=1 Tax=Archocentrus centrarchus TaxID=63155 RepID=UPI0011EA2F15|nr:uncharacterized protein LOC115772998 isoform X2 [Archocentrus centrarchus]